MVIPVFDFVERNFNKIRLFWLCICWDWAESVVSSPPPAERTQFITGRNKLRSAEVCFGFGSVSVSSWSKTVREAWWFQWFESKIFCRAVFPLDLLDRVHFQVLSLKRSWLFCASRTGNEMEYNPPDITHQAQHSISIITNVNPTVRTYV